MKPSADIELDTRGLPDDLDSERFILVGIFKSEDSSGTFLKVAELVTEASFTLEKHKLVFSAMRNVVGRGLSINYETVLLNLVDRDLLQRVNGLIDVSEKEISEAYLHELANKSVPMPNLEFFCKRVADCEQLRRVYGVLENLKLRVLSRDSSFEQIVADFQASMLAEQARGFSNSNGKPSEIIRAAGGLRPLLSPAQSEATIMTPWPKVNEATNGLQPGQVWIIGGMPSAGKTSFALQLGAAAVFNKHGVQIHSREVPRDRLLSLMLCSHAGLDSQEVKAGRVNAMDWTALGNSADEFVKHDDYLHIEDEHNSTVSAIAAQLRRRVGEKRPAQLLIVDFVQLLRPIGRVENRTKELDQITYALKDLAKELGIPVVVLSQLNVRRMDEWMKQEPVLGDFRDSGAIEQVADVAFILRLRDLTERHEPVRDVEAFLLKQREGRTGKILLQFVAALRHFDEIKAGLQASSSRRPNGGTHTASPAEDVQWAYPD